MLQLLLQTILIIIVALFMGLNIKTGFLGLLVLLALAVGWGLAFAGYSVGFALKTKNAQASQAGTFIFFPLLFLSTTFVPYDLIQSSWLKVAAKINPTTYVFEGMRALLIDGWVGKDIWIGFGVIVIICAITITFATMSAKRAVSRG
jgi:ABC-2 type transport system permease protein